MNRIEAFNRLTDRAGHEAIRGAQQADRGYSLIGSKAYSMALELFESGMSILADTDYTLGESLKRAKIRAQNQANAELAEYRYHNAEVFDVVADVLRDLEFKYLEQKQETTCQK